jgi:molybdopterin-containing oxidoreductase family iron-sulfur binding subunit
MMPAQLHTACALLNQMLGSEDHQDYGAAASVAMPVLPAAQAARVFAEVKPGDYSAAILWGVNPAYWLPDEDAWRSALSAIPLKVFIGLHQDETAQDCHVVLPEHHWLEAWGDCEMPGGPLSLQQPAIGPLYDSRQGEEILLGWIAALGGAVPAQYRLYLMERWKREVLGAASPVGFESFWNAALHDGVLERPVPDAAPRVVKPRAVEKAALSASKAMTARSPAGGSFELLLVPASAVWDGRYANNGWLQEMPDPVTKATWSNPAAISVADAKRLGVRDGDVLRIEAGGRSVEAPAIVQPGQAAGVISLALGYGRRAGSVAGGIGVNAWPLAATGDALSGSPFVVPASVAPTGGRSEVPQTQTHHRMEGRDIVRSVTMVDYARGGAGHEAAGEMPTLYPSQQFPEHKWGMAIDLAACVGCSGCVVACQSENNIAVVGPEQVLRGREMHWIRIDRYYEGDPANPAVVHQPMLCQQCDNAPCENVCPVNATNHSPDGLNQMIYNRCVGTRYCANNCPYKVRRFNFLEFTAAKTEPESLVFNPEVTVRPRGVMEKCTFCVQRIQDARQRSGGEGRSLRDGEIVPACAAACPAQAIVFGDLKDPSSEVSRLSANDRGYKVLAELGVKPSITYLSRLTNPAGNNGGGREKAGGHHEG